MPVLDAQSVAFEVDSRCCHGFVHAGIDEALDGLLGGYRIPDHRAHLGARSVPEVHDGVEVVIG